MQVEAGALKTFSKLKWNVTTRSTKRPGAQPPHHSKIHRSDIVRAYQDTIRVSRQVAEITHKPRIMTHAAVLAAVGLVMLGAHTTNLSTRTNLVSKLTQGATGYGSELDPTSQAEVAANLAIGTNMLVSADATQTASKLTSQVALAGDGGVLAKRQVVATAQPASHTITNYVVMGGDTLSAIAQKFNVTSDTIRWANNLTDDSIAPGQTLKILPTTGVLYTVQAGDTTASLAAKYQANDAQIAEYNDADVKGLTPGQQIIIPDGQIQEAPKPAPAAVTRLASNVGSVLPSYSFVGNGNTYAWGNCTWYVASRRAVPAFWGDARSWYYNAQYSGYGVGSMPRVGAIAWTGAGWYGHVALVESVSGNDVTISEMNYGGNFGRVTYRTVPYSAFLYIY